MKSAERHHLPGPRAHLRQDPPTVGTRAAGRVMLVEDDESVRTLLSRSLRLEGYEVTELDSADFAIARIQTGERPDVLITDHNLPGDMQGRELAHAALDLVADAVAILLTGDHIPEMKLPGNIGQRLLRLSKPVTIRELLASIVKLQDRRPATATT